MVIGSPPFISQKMAIWKGSNPILRGLMITMVMNHLLKGCFNTHLEHTHKKLYQQAISRDSFHNWRCRGIADRVWSGGVLQNVLGFIAYTFLLDTGDSLCIVCFLYISHVTKKHAQDTNLYITSYIYVYTIITTIIYITIYTIYR